MPAKSKSQQRLMGMVHAYQKGELDTKSVDASLLAKVKEIAGGMKKSSAKDYAETKHKGLPELKEFLRNMSFVDFLAEGQHSQYAQIKRKRASAGNPTDMKTTLTNLYRGIKQQKGEVSFADFKNAVISKGKLSPAGWNSITKMQSFQDFLELAPFSDRGHSYQAQEVGKKDPWSHVKVDREQRRASRQPSGAQDYFQS